MINSIHQLQAINLAIWIRDNARKVDREVLVYNLQNLAEYNVFSNRQLQAICLGELSYTTIGGYTQKKTKNGGNFSPESLENLREILYAKHNGQINYQAIERALTQGTSQGMISKLTGVAQSTISKHFGGK
jgi:hypothetical protein